MISISQQNKLFVLENNSISYVIGVDEYGYVENYYFGKKIAVDETVRNIRIERGHSTIVPNGKTRCDDGCQFMREISSCGQSDYRTPSFAATFSDGSRLSDFKYFSSKIVEKPHVGVLPKCDGGQTLEITVFDRIANVKAYMYYTVYDDVNAIVRSVRFENCGTEPFVVDRAYSFNLDIPNDNYNVTRLWGAQVRERNVDTQKLAHGICELGSRRGVSSAQLNPFLALSSSYATQNVGCVYGFNLVYSGNWQLNVELDELDNVRVNGGISAFDFSWKLNGGESLDTPEVVCVCSDKGFNGMSQAFHDLYRDHLINKHFVRKPRPIVINNWEATYFDFDEKKLFDIIDSVKDSGIDTFVLDDGWFGQRDNDTSSLGDWKAYDKKLPNGIRSIADYAHAKGLKFGLWFEPEMVSRNSDLYRRHPDWAIHANGRTLCEGRGQYVLDMSLPEVVQYVKDTLSKHIENDRLDYIKWDMNRPLTEFCSVGLPVERQKEFAHRYVLGLYEVLAYIVDRYPDVIIEGCAAGGCRFDPAMLHFCPQIWASDNSDAYRRTFIQQGTSVCYPLSTMDCHVSACPNHQTGRTTPFKSRVDVASLGALGYELDTTQLTEQEKTLVKDANDKYRQTESLLQNGDLYRLTEFNDSDVFAQMVVSKDKREAVVVVMVYHPTGGDILRKIKLVGLDESRKYRIEETDVVAHGSTLANRGLCLPQCGGDYVTFTYHLSVV